jgi:hypothetical protein
VLFGLFAPGVTSLALAVPDAFIYVIGGLAMLRVLQQSLAAAFGGKFTAGAVVCMVVTVTELIPEARFTLLGIGAPFWGLVFGIATSLLLEPEDFRGPASANAGAPVAARDARPRPPVPAWALEPDTKPVPTPLAARQDRPAVDPAPMPVETPAGAAAAEIPQTPSAAPASDAADRDEAKADESKKAAPSESAG